MQLRSDYNKGIRFLLSVINIFSKYIFFSLNEKVLQLLMHFKKNLHESERCKQAKNG